MAADRQTERERESYDRKKLEEERAMAKPDEENAIWSSWIGLLRFGQKSDSSEKESEDEEEESEDEEEEGRRRWREKKRREGICKCRVRRNSRFA